MGVVLALLVSAAVFLAAVWLITAAVRRFDNLVEGPLDRFADWRVHVRWRWDNRR